MIPTRTTVHSGVLAAGLGLSRLCQKKPISAGIWLGVFLPIKYYSATVLLYFALHKNWKVVTAGCATAAAVIALGLFSLALTCTPYFYDRSWAITLLRN